MERRIVLVTLLLAATPACHGFLLPQPQQVQRSSLSPFAAPQLTTSRGRSRSSPSSFGPLYFFGRNNNDNEQHDNNKKKDDVDKKAAAESDKEENEDNGGGGFFSFLRNRDMTTKPSEKTEEVASATSSTTATTAATLSSGKVEKESSTKQNNKSVESPSKTELSPEEQAQKLRAEAEKARLEAERMDAELTLRKIDKLERELAHAAKKKSSSDNGETTTLQKVADPTEELQRELDMLLTKVQPGISTTTNKPKTTAATSQSASTATTKSTPQETISEESALPSSLLETDTSTTAGSTTTTSSSRYEPVWPDYIEPYDEDTYQELLKNLKFMPSFLQASMLGMVDLTVDTARIDNTEGDGDDEGKKNKVELNVTELAIRTDKLGRCDFSYSSRPTPDFMPWQIEKAERDLLERMEQMSSEEESKRKPGGAGDWLSRLMPKNDKNASSSSSSPLFGSKPNFWTGMEMIPDEEVGMAESSMKQAMTEFLKKTNLQELKKTDTKKLAQLYLEYSYYISEVASATEDMSGEDVMELVSQEPWLKPFLGENGTIKSELEGTIDGLYPKCTVNRETDDKPTEAQIQRFVTEVLPQVKFQTSSKPESVKGGWIIRGTVPTKSGDDLIDQIDARMEKSNLKDKMTVLYCPDFAYIATADTDDMFEMDSVPDPILFVVAPEICRDSKPVQLSAVTALGLATSWYLSLYPFLLNSNIASRVDEQLALVDAGMNPDLSWLTDMSLPLFASFMGIQLIHELGHLSAAGANQIKTSVPTFVPSIITGITSTVTTFRSPPKNNAATFDFAISGPLAGMIASILSIVLGSQLTTSADAAMLPALPLEILRQSTLGGGLIESVLGNGALYVPEGALGTAAVAGMTVPLHPIAIAGYISLVVNALASLPIGTTDGGRVAIALFGRGAKLIWGSSVMFAILIAGFFGSDLLLFYFAFCIAFQSGNEVPARNEVDKLDIPRVFLATGTYVLAALALIPFQ